MANKYYAIKEGRGVKNKIVRSWEECKKIVDGYNSIYKSFKNEEDALTWLGSIKNIEQKKEENKKAMEYSKKKKKDTISLSNIRINKELLQQFVNKCNSEGYNKERVIEEMFKDWIC